MVRKFRVEPVESSTVYMLRGAMSGSISKVYEDSRAASAAAKGTNYTVVGVQLEPFNPEKYPYNIGTVYYNLDEAQKILIGDGYFEVEGMDELEFSQYIHDRQNGGFKEDDDSDIRALQPIEGLLCRTWTSYRGGEKEYLVYAPNDEEALRMACDWADHSEYWEIVEE